MNQAVETRNPLNMTKYFETHMSKYLYSQGWSFRTIDTISY